MKAQMTLLELSNILTSKGYPDIFDFQVDGNILNLEEMKGSLADVEGDETIYFEVIKIGDDKHLDTIIEINLDEVKDIK